MVTKERMVVFAALVCGMLHVGSLQADLVGHWTFDDQAVTDISGYRVAGVHDGTAVGNVLYTATDTPTGSGYALDLTQGGHVYINNSNMKIGGSANQGDNLTYQDTFDTHLNTTHAMTIAFWGKGWPDALWEPFISQKGESSDGNRTWHGYQVRRYGSTQNATFTLRGSSGVDDPQGTATPNDGNWHHYAAVWDGANGKRYLYIDGVLDIEIDDSDSYSVATYEYLVFGGRDINGSIGYESRVMLDDVQFYDNALSSSAVNALMVPEPCTMGLLAIGGGAMLLRKRRRA